MSDVGTDHIDDLTPSTAAQIANEDGHDERLSDAAPLTDGKKCRIRPVHIFLGIACCMTLCGFVLTVYGGVKIYYHDVFKVLLPVPFQRCPSFHC